MWFFFFTFVFMHSVSFRGSVRGYTIHSSCDYIKPDLITAIDRAFLMASQVATELQKPVIDPHIQDLVEILFGTAVADRIRVQERMEGVWGMHNQVTFDAFKSDRIYRGTDVAIYCSFDHVTPVLEPKTNQPAEPAEFQDDWYVFEAGEPFFEDCRQFNGVPLNENNKPLMAFTNNENQRRVTADNDGRNPGTVSNPSVIYICGWYIRMLSQKGLLNSPDAVQNARSFIGNDDQVEHPPTRTAAESTQMDILCRLEGTILHELFHTIAGQIALDDSPPDGSEATNSYGWTNVVILKAQRNAESLAFMGIGSDLILRTEFKATAAGNIVRK